MTNRFTPAFFIAFFNVIVFAVMNGFQVVTQSPIWYVTPPVFAFANVPFALLKFETARALFMLLIPLTVLCSFLVVSRLLKERDGKENDWLMLSGVLITLFSYPLYFLFERGNIDGVVLLCMCLSLWFMPKRPWLGGLLLAAAVHFKLYPVLLLVPLFLSHRWKPLLWTSAWIFALAVVAAPYWDDFGTLLSKPSNLFQLFENGSLVNTLLFLGMLAGNFFGKMEVLWAYAPLYAAVLYALLLSVVFMADFKLSQAASPRQHVISALLYFPFMVALPRSVYHYEFVILIALIPVLHYLWKVTGLPSERLAMGLLVLGWLLHNGRRLPCISSQKYLCLLSTGVGTVACDGWYWCL